MQHTEMLAQLVGGAGFVAALDQSGGSTPAALKALGVGEDMYSNEEEMFALMHAMRVRVLKAPSMNGRRVLGVILFERTMDAQIEAVPVPRFLWQRGIISFVKIDQGLEKDKGGVQLMKPIPGLDSLLSRARSRDVLGTKMRSVINVASHRGIGDVVRQQFELANHILDQRLVPIIEPEVNIASATRDECEKILLGELSNALDGQSYGRRVVLKLTPPVTDGLYAPLIAHPNCARVLALSGGLSQEAACAALARNRGMIASFSRALLQDLRVQMDDAEFNETLGRAVERIYLASTIKQLG
jgi:fructose-bisphosphate aldolase, class I